MKSSTVFFMVLVLVATAAAQRPVDCSYTRPGCFCPTIWDPVCATNGCTYGNKCLLGCAGAEFAYGGECKKC